MQYTYFDSTHVYQILSNYHLLLTMNHLVHIEENKRQNRILAIIRKHKLTYNTNVIVRINNQFLSVIAVTLPEGLMHLHVFKEEKTDNNGKVYFISAMVNLFDDIIINLYTVDEFDTFLENFITDSAGYMPDEYYIMVTFRKELSWFNVLFKIPCLHNNIYCPTCKQSEIDAKIQRNHKFLYNSSINFMAIQKNCSHDSVVKNYSFDLDIRYQLLCLKFSQEFDSSGF